MFDADERRKLEVAREKAHNHGEELSKWLDTNEGKEAAESLRSEYMQTLQVGLVNVFQQNPKVGLLIMMSGTEIRDGILGLCHLAFMFGAKSAK